MIVLPKKIKDKNSTDITIPRWLYESMSKDSELIRHLTHYRGIGWINAVRKEMERDKKYKIEAFSDKGLING
jgi:hypothetical protein